MTESITHTQTLVAEECVNCGVAFGITERYRRIVKKSHATFYCPNGHGQSWPQQTVEEKRIAQLEEDTEWYRNGRDGANRRAEAAVRSAAAHKGAHTRTKNRIKAGLCPHCNQHFADVERHLRQHVEVPE